jgi:hypothetical protein
MTAIRKQLVVSIKDVRFATQTCRHCNTRLTVDLAVLIDSPERPPFRVPRDCPRCHQPFDSAVATALEGMHRVYRALDQLGDAVTFTGESEEDDPE